MSSFLRVSLLTLFFLLLIPAGALCQNLQLYTEDYSPYNYEQDGEVRGVNTDLLLRATEKAGLDIAREDIRLVPWARAYSAARNNPNTCVYTTMRTREREPFFKWVGPLVNTEKVLVALRDREVEINSLQDIENYRTGVVIEDVCVHLLSESGVPEENIDKSASALLNLRKLVRGRIDLVAYDELTLEYIAKKNNIDPSLFETVFVLGRGDHYLACHPETNATVLDRLQNALDELSR
ncbi:MAG: substrate-binding periplasmic protein [Desulfonatronovibrionaceae bacterium]